METLTNDLKKALKRNKILALLGSLVIIALGVISIVYIYIDLRVTVYLLMSALLLNGIYNIISFYLKKGVKNPISFLNGAISITIGVLVIIFGPKEISDVLNDIFKVVIVILGLFAMLKGALRIAFSGNAIVTNNSAKYSLFAGTIQFLLGIAMVVSPLFSNYALEIIAGCYLILTGILIFFDAFPIINLKNVDKNVKTKFEEKEVIDAEVVDEDKKL